MALAAARARALALSGRRPAFASPRTFLPSMVATAVQPCTAATALQPCSHRRREQHQRGTHHNGQVPASSASLPLALLHAHRHRYTPGRCAATCLTSQPQQARLAQQPSIHRLWHNTCRTPPHPRCHRHKPPHTLPYCHTPPHMTASISHHAQCRHTLAAIATRRYTLTAIATHCPRHMAVCGAMLHDHGRRFTPSHARCHRHTPPHGRIVRHAKSQP